MDTCTAPTAAPVGQELIGQIQARLPRLSPTMRSIGGYCVRTHAWLHERSIDDVAEHCGTVPSSVVRFARLFGHKGFHDLKQAFLDPGATPFALGKDGLAGSRSRLLSRLDEDVYQLSELQTLIQDGAFPMALAWIREQPKLSLTFHGELDRMAAMHLGDALQRVGKCVLLADQLQLRAHRADASVTCIHLDLERPGLQADPSIETRCLAGFVGHQIHLLGTDRLRGSNVHHHQLTLPVFGSTLGRRLQKALSIADMIETALH